MKKFDIIYSGLTSFGLKKALLWDRVTQKWVVQYEDDYFGPESVALSSFSEAVQNYRLL